MDTSISATMTTKVAAGAVKTIYRKCPCGETAHDFTFYMATEKRPAGFAYACRNCHNPRFTK